MKYISVTLFIDYQERLKKRWTTLSNGFPAVLPNMLPYHLSVSCVDYGSVHLHSFTLLLQSIYTLMVPPPLIMINVFLHKLLPLK